MSSARYASLYERLVANTRVDSESGCWLWTGSVGTNRRPQLSIRKNGKHCTCNAAREMLDLFYVLDSEAEASHLCSDSWLCISPDHLEPETKQQNHGATLGQAAPAWSHMAPQILKRPELRHMKSTRYSSLLALATLGILGGIQGPTADLVIRPGDGARTLTLGSNVQKSAPSLSPMQRQLEAILNRGLRGTGRSRIPGGGWSVATDRRRAKKARNVARNRKAHRA